MIGCKKCEPSLPWSVMRFVRAYKPKFRDILVRFLQERRERCGTLRDRDVFECVGMAYEVFESEMSSRVAFPAPDAKTVELAIQQAKTGEGQTIQEILNELS